MNMSAGPGFFLLKIITFHVCLSYFLFVPKRTYTCYSFYRSILPEISKSKALLYTFQKYYNFGKLFLDRILLLKEHDFSYTSEGWEHFEELKNNGGIILMSHVGNWEVAAHLFKKNKMDIMIYMGVKNKEQLESIQKNNLIESDVKIIAVEEDNPSPFHIIDGVNFLKKGGFVSLTGDRTWGDTKNTVSANFSG